MMSLYWWCLCLCSCDGLPCAAMPTCIASAANRYTTVVHIHVRDFMFFSSLLREWRFRLARSGIAEENVHAPERIRETTQLRLRPGKNSHGAETNHAARLVGREGDSAGASCCESVQSG